MSDFFEHRVGNYEVNEYQVMRLSSLFVLLQEVAIQDCENLHAGKKQTIDRGILWVITLQKVQIKRMPTYGEQITVRTWPGTMMHFFFPRYYEVVNEEGNILVSGSAIWALMDATSRTIVSPDQYEIRIEGQENGRELPLPSPIGGEDTTQTWNYVVPRSALDMNGHMNHTRYFDLVDDSSSHVGQIPHVVTAEYTKEVKAGESLTMKVRDTEQELFWEAVTDTKAVRIRYEYATS